MTSVSQAFQTRTPTRSLNSSQVGGTFRTPNRDSASRSTYDYAEPGETHSAAKARLDNQSRDIKTILDNKYNAEIDLWRNRLDEAEAQRVVFETENLRLAQEIHYIKSRISAAEVDKLQKIYSQEAVRANNLGSIRSDGDSQSLSLRLEAERLRGLLASKVEECNEIKANFSKLEILNAENREKNEAAQDYAARISRLKEDYNLRLLEVEELKNQRNRLEADNAELQRAEKEAGNLKTLLEAKRSENSRIRLEKSEVEAEIYKNKKSEALLLEKEALLKNRIHSLEGAAAATESLRKSQYLEKSQVHILQQDGLRKSLHVEEAVLEGDVNDRQRLASIKAVEVESLRKSFHDLNGDLTRVEGDSSLADVEARVWREKAAEAARVKEAEVARANRLRDASITVAVTENLREKAQLEDRIDTLHKVVSHKESDLYKVQRENDLTLAEKRLLEDERLRLQVQIDDLVKRQDDNERRFQTEIRSRDNVHSFSVEKMRKDHDNEKRRVNNQIQALRNVIDIKRDEAERARQEGNGFCIKLVECDAKARAADTESQYWRNETTRVARQKDLEYSVEKSLTAQQLRDLDRSQSIEKLQKLKEAEALRGVIDYKSREALDLRSSQTRTAAELAAERYQKARLQTEAEINRSRALEAERSKHSSLLAKDIVHSANVDNLRRSGHIESAVLRTEVNHLSDALIRKDIEARSWRDSYARVSTSPYKRY